MELRLPIKILETYDSCASTIGLKGRSEGWAVRKIVLTLDDEPKAC